MKALLSPLSLAFAAVAIVGGVFGSIPVLVIGAALWVGSIAFTAARNAQAGVQSFDATALSPDSRILFRPIKQLHEDLAEIVHQGQSNPAVKVVGEEALGESSQIVKQAFDLANFRTQLEKTLKGRSVAELEVNKLKEKLAGCTSDEERHAIQSALEAHQSEYDQYAQVADNMDRIDRQLRQAQATLSELKARIAVGASGAGSNQVGTDELQDILGRLKSLGKSFDEAQSITQEVHQ